MRAEIRNSAAHQGRPPEDFPELALASRDELTWRPRMAHQSVQSSEFRWLLSSSFIGGGVAASSRHGGVPWRRRPKIANTRRASASDAAGLFLGVCWSTATITTRASSGYAVYMRQACARGRSEEHT